MSEPSNLSGLTADGLRRYLEYLSPIARLLDDNTPLGEQLRVRYEQVVADTDWVAEKYLGSLMQDFMRAVARSVAVRHPDLFMQHTAMQWASAIESMFTLPVLMDAPTVEESRELLGACRYLAPGVESLMKRLPHLVPLPEPPTDPELRAWHDALGAMQRAASPPAQTRDHSAEQQYYPAVEITGAVDCDETSVIDARRAYFRDVVSHFSILDAFLAPSVLAVMRDFTRVMANHATPEEIAIPADDLALLVINMTLEIVEDPSDPKSQYGDVVVGLRRGHEEKLETLRRGIGQALPRGFRAQGRISEE